MLIIVCANTDIAEYFYQRISGERVVEVVDDGTTTGRRRKKSETKIVYEQGAIFSELLANSEGVTRTLRIDSKMLAEAESANPNRNRAQAAEDLRQVVGTIGKRGQPGEQIRCVVSVAMLNEGWDANNVTHILGLRAFSSQLLCEQVVGRGLRRMNYTPDPETGLLTEEYVDVYGIPFSVIPFRGRATNARAPDDKPKNHVRALSNREHFEIRFPVVEGYAFALQKTKSRRTLRPRNRSAFNLKLTPPRSMSNPPWRTKPVPLPHQVPVERYFKIARCFIGQHTSKPLSLRSRIGLSTNWSVIAKPLQIQTAIRNSGCSLDTVSFRKSSGALMPMSGQKLTSVAVIRVNSDKINTLRVLWNV